jgi:hypothetical protein
MPLPANEEEPLGPEEGSLIDWPLELPLWDRPLEAVLLDEPPELLLELEEFPLLGGHAVVTANAKNATVQASARLIETSRSMSSDVPWRDRTPRPTPAREAPGVHDPERRNGTQKTAGVMNA